MTNLANTDSQRKRLSALAQLVRILMRDGITTTSALMAETGYSERSIWAAKGELRSSAAECRVQPAAVQPSAVEVQPVALEGAAECRVHKERVSPHTPLPKEITTLPSSVVLEDTPHCAAPDRMLVEKRIRQAAGDRLNCMAPGLHDISAVMGLLEGGADLERDVVPAIAAKARSMQPGSVSSWGYMIPVIRDAMAKRRQGSAAVVSIGKDAADEQIRRIRAIAGDTSRGRMMPVEEAWS